MRIALAALFAAFTLTACSTDQSAVRDGDPPVDQDVIARYLQTQQQTRVADEHGMKTLPSGLRYQVLEEGEGRSPGYNDTVLVHYRGWNEKGQLFDDSHRRGRPATFEVGEVIEGWTLALRQMQEGDKWRLIIPPYLAYGAKGNGQAIGPNETLTFEVELLQVR